MRLTKLLYVLVLLVPSSVVFAQTGKITGAVTDLATGDPLPGVNVVIEGTTQGSTTDVDGYYTILNVRPGTYSVRATFIGYTASVQSDVRVNINLTTNLDFQLQEETVGLDEVVVAAQRPVVQRDVSASVANLSAQEIENLPVTDVAEVIGLQAGFERGLTVRGAGGNQVSFQMDGITLGGGTNNNPFTGISYTAVDEVQVQTGGFNAEYGNVRSGLINVVTKEGNRTRYTADVIVRYASPYQKYFDDQMPNDPNSYWVRPYLDNTPNAEGKSAAMDGTAAVWDDYTRWQYRDFEGWKAKANQFEQNTDNDPSNDVTPEQMMEAYKWYIRKDFKIQEPDYEVDGTIGGPVPLISQMLGDLRFTASYRQVQEAYIVPQLRDSYGERTAQGKLTSDIATGLKLEFQGLWAKQEGINPGEGNNQGEQASMWTGQMPYYPWDGGAYLANNWNEGTIWATHYRNPMDVTRNLISAHITHTLSPTTFYEFQMQRSGVEYSTFATDERDQTVLHTVGNIKLNEEPFGWEWRDRTDILGAGIRNGGHWFSARDSSKVANYQAKFDLTSQLNRWSQLKTGLEYNYNDYDINWGEVDPAHPHHANPKFVWNRQPQQGALYAQNRLEFKGMVANIGLRLDYFHAGGDWYVYSDWERAFRAAVGAANLDEVLPTEPTKHQFALSPRLGVSFPITENSKLYFNYGHFRQMLNPLDLFTISNINTGAVDYIGNPNHPLPKTVMYELGYEQGLFNMFHIRVAGFYRDLSDQPRSVYYESLDSEVRYSLLLPYYYNDVRGFELTLSKNRGDWVRGFVNYSYLAYKDGNFGYANQYQNPVRMRNYVTTSTDHYQGISIPEPYARLNLEFITPKDFGPLLGGFNLLGDWRLNLLGEWRMGASRTWTGGTNLIAGRSPLQGVQGNIRLKDFWMLDMRLSKNISTKLGSAQLFVDFNNVLNIKNFYYSGYIGDRDEERYLKSLHLPEKTFEDFDNGAPYDYVPGNDKVGDYRKKGVEFVPIVIVNDLTGTGQNRPLYYLKGEGAYYTWNGSAYVKADEGVVKKVLDDKAYIDMPNQPFATFLNPRNVFFGLRISL